MDVNVFNPLQVQGNFSEHDDDDNDLHGVHDDAIEIEEHLPEEEDDADEPGLEVSPDVAEKVLKSEEDSESPENPDDVDEYELNSEDGYDETENVDGLDFHEGQLEEGGEHGVVGVQEGEDLDEHADGVALSADEPLVDAESQEEEEGEFELDGGDDEIDYDGVDEVLDDDDDEPVSVDPVLEESQDFVLHSDEDSREENPE